jgi:hypothetical protein
MADNNNPFSVRMETDDKEKLIELIQESGKSSKEFMSILMGNKHKFPVYVTTSEVVVKIGGFYFLSVSDDIAEIINNTQCPEFKEDSKLCKDFTLIDHHSTAKHLEKYCCCTIQIENKKTEAM